MLSIPHYPSHHVAPHCPSRTVHPACLLAGHLPLRCEVPRRVGRFVSGLLQLLLRRLQRRRMLRVVYPLQPQVFERLAESRRFQSRLFTFAPHLTHGMCIYVHT